MAYYYPAPYYYGYPAPSPPPFFAPPTAPPHHAAHQQAFPPPHYQPSFVAPPSGYHPATAGPSLDEEEAAAFAYLQAIKRRRQELEASRAHEAGSAARAQAQKEAEVQALISKELAKQQALCARYEAEELRKRQYREAIQRQRQELKAARAAERQKAVQYQTRSRDLAPNSAFGHDDISNVLGSLFGINPAQEPQYGDCFAPRSSDNSLEARFSSAARAYASAGQGREQRSQQPKSEHDVFSLTDLLRSIGLVEDDVSGPTCSQQCTNSQAPTASSTPSATASSAKRPSQSGLPAEVNDILHRHLGLHIDPVASQNFAPSVKNAKGNGVPAGLNELLSQFGLVFEPETETETKPGPSHFAQPDNAAHPSAVDSATQSKPTAPKTAPAPQPKPAAPFTSLLGEFANVHPAVADILRNVEVAVTEEVKQRSRAGKTGCSGPCDQQCASGCQKASGQTKGKGVAEGEKNPVAREAEPEPAANPTTSLSTLDNIQHQFESLRANFTFPEHLSFARDSRGSHSPPLLFNRVNSAYHAQVNALLQLLLQTDSINSGGEKAVRQKRKEVVKKVEDEIERLEQLRDDLWEDVKERRERGEESEPDADQERSWSDTDSVKNEVTVGEEETIVEPEQTEASGEAEGYEVVDNQPQNATPAEAAVTTDAPAPAEDSTPAEDSVPTDTPIPAEASASTEDLLEQPQSPSYADAAKHALERSQEPSAQTPIPESAPESSAIEPQAEAVPAEQDAASSPQQVDASPLPSASHHPVTVEDAEDENEDRKQKRDRKTKGQARRAGSDSEDYEML